MIEAFFMGRPVFKKAIDEDQKLYWIVQGKVKIFLALNQNTHCLTINPFKWRLFFLPFQLLYLFRHCIELIYQ
jgi:hypothetical protein